MWNNKIRKIFFSGLIYSICFSSFGITAAAHSHHSYNNTHKNHLLSHQNSVSSNQSAGLGWHYLPNMDNRVFHLASDAYENALHNGTIRRPYLTIVDFSKPSTEKRLWVINMATHRLMFYDYVAHGRGSGFIDPTRFSNTPNTFQSSIGVILTGMPYRGISGYSMRLYGLENGINNNLFYRTIVMHGDRNVSSGFIHQHGFLGFTLGCFGVPYNDAPSIINTIRGGSLIFAYYPDLYWLQNSRFLDSSYYTFGVNDVLNSNTFSHYPSHTMRFV